MVRYNKYMTIRPASNVERLQKVHHHLDIVQSPLHGRESGKVAHPASPSPTVASSHRRYIKPAPVVALTVSTEDQRHITQCMLGYYFMKVSLFNSDSQKVEDHKLGCNKIAVGQLVKLPCQKVSVMVFEINDLSIKEKGNYQLRFHLYRAENLGSLKVEQLNLALNPSFQIFSGRKYYSAERKLERQVLLGSKEVAEKKAKSVMNLLNDYFSRKLANSSFKSINDTGELVTHVNGTVVNQTKIPVAATNKRNHSTVSEPDELYLKKKLRSPISAYADEDSSQFTYDFKFIPHDSSTLSTSISTYPSPSELSIDHGYKFSDPGPDFRYAILPSDTPFDLPFFSMKELSDVGVYNPQDYLNLHYD